MVRICPVIVSNKTLINMYTAVSMGSLMHVAGTENINMREFMVYDQHPISEARNKAVEEFMADKLATHIFFLDDDVIPPVDVIPTLLGDNKPIVSGWYRLRGNKFPSIFHKTKHGYTQHVFRTNVPSDMIEADGVGAGCLLVERKVFDIMSKPYFKEQPLKELQGCGEDLFFCEKAQSFGFKINVDPRIYCNHFHFNLL